MCANALKQWGIAVAAYESANNKIPRALVRGGLLPCFMGTVPQSEMDPADPEVNPEEWNVFSMNPYIECVDKQFRDNGNATGVMICPATNGDLFLDIIRAWIQ